MYGPDFIGPRYLKSMRLTAARIHAHRLLRENFRIAFRRGCWTEFEIDIEFDRVESALLDENRIAKMGFSQWEV